MLAQKIAYLAHQTEGCPGEGFVKRKYGSCLEVHVLEQTTDKNNTTYYGTIYAKIYELTFLYNG